MDEQPDDVRSVLRALWAADGSADADVDAEFAAQKPCRNMKDFSFDGMAEPGSDLRAVWRDRLEREGKLSTSGQSVRDLVLGTDPSSDR
ncbi:MAG TPA: hypothetical protein VME70_14120 [Mycobacteriales bacterium]|nr:hypothetical protein [Mycobacteriales bacterium]